MRIHQRTRAIGVLVLAAVLAASAAGCGGDKTQTGSGSNVQVSTDMSSKPTITIEDAAAKPAKLETTDIVEGAGPEAKEGDAVSVQYVGMAWSDGKEFDASWDRGGKPFTVSPLGRARVIDGWNQGLVGAKAGGRRLIVIPPELGYGAQGAPGAIKPNETLIFVVDVLKIN